MSFLGLDYKKVSKIRRFYIFCRSGKWYDLISAECRPVDADSIAIKSFIKNNVVDDADVAVFQLRGKFYYLVSDDSKLTAMRICQ